MNEVVTLELDSEDLGIFRTPVQTRVSTESYRAYKEAAGLVGMGLARLCYRLGETPEEYATSIANIAGVGDTRVRTWMYRLARSAWARFKANSADPMLEPLYMIEYVDIRRAGDIWVTTRHYPKHQVVIHDKPQDIEAALESMRAAGYTIHSYGASWHRAWPGRLTPVRTAEEIRRARQDIVNGTFYIPEDFNLPPGQIDLAFDL